LKIADFNVPHLY